jgi:hypothetical protein
VGRASPEAHKKDPIPYGRISMMGFALSSLAFGANADRLGSAGMISSPTPRSSARREAGRDGRHGGRIRAFVQEDASSERLMVRFGDACLSAFR